MQINTARAPELHMNLERAAELAAKLAPERAVALEQWTGPGRVPSNPVAEPYDHGAYVAGLVAALFEIVERQEERIAELEHPTNDDTKEEA